MRPTTLLLAALQSAIAAPHFPVFSWDTLPVFLHVSTQSQKVFSPADLRVAVRFPAVTLEKWQGCSSPGRPTQEDATLATAAALKSLSPSIAVFAWYDSMRIYANSSLNPSILDKVNQSCVNNVHTPFLETHREYLLPNASGQPALDPYIHAHVYDHRSEVVRAYWRDSCVNLTLTGLIDGCGADASQQTGSFILGLSPDVSAAWTDAHIQAVAATTAVVGGAGGVILGKLGQQLGVSTNAVLQEGCVASNATVNTLRSAAAAAKRDGVRYLYECHSDGTVNDLAAFLVGAGVDHYWGFGAWVTWAGGFESRWLPEFTKPLGAPLEDAAYLRGTWTRRFASGTNVTFDALTNRGTIVWAT